jgi:glycerol-3-phosphate dehydrogenase
MKRNLQDFATKEFDVLVIGGGIYGACVAWDATLRGLAVALVEKADFGGATSANSLKTIHGGLRYLQDGHLKLMRTMINERKAWLRIAPHLVHPLTCLMPTYHTLTKNRLALGCALKINDLMSFDRNRGLESDKHLANGRTLSRADFLAQIPALAPEGITGGAMWADAQMYNSERLLISMLRSAVAAGATIANYVEVKGFLRNEDGVYGVQAQDAFSTETFPIRAKLVINCTGPWTDKLLEPLGLKQPSRHFHLSTALNLVTRQLWPDRAVGFLSHSTAQNGHQPRSRMLFTAPWRDYSLIGTFHAPYSGRPEDFTMTEPQLWGYLAEINRAVPGAGLTLADVYHVQQGFLPAVAGQSAKGAVKLVRQSQIYDHDRQDGVRGLITVVGVKYTTARYVAQQAVDLALQRLGKKLSPCQTAHTPLFGGQIVDFADFQANIHRRLQSDQISALRWSGASSDAERDRFASEDTRSSDFAMALIIRQLSYNYGAEYGKILSYVQRDPILGQTLAPGVPVLRAEVVHAVEEEMAYTLADVVQHRTELGSAGPPDPVALRNTAVLMSQMLGWDEARVAQELTRVQQSYHPAIRQRGKRQQIPT